MKTIPTDEEWDRLEKLAESIAELSMKAREEALEKLRQLGEPESVLSLLNDLLLTPSASEPLDVDNLVANRFTLQRKLGGGGMGSVWQATQAMIGRDVAIKFIHPSLVSPMNKERFTAEMKMLGRLQHPGIVQIFHADVHILNNGAAVPFFVMELVDGEPLNHWAAAHRNNWETLLRVMSEICAAVQHAHDREIVHRDLKPANILVRNDGHPVVLDFGIARLTSTQGDDADEMFSGTPIYAAPEQHLGRDRNFRSGESVDVYAAGAILFEMLAGRRLFEFPKGTSIAEMRHAVLCGPPPRLADVLPDCPVLLDEVVARALRRDPADRYYSIAALARALAAPGILPVAHLEIQLPPWMPKQGAIVPQTKWKLVKKLGAGSVGEIWLGKHDELDNYRVFKFCDTVEKARTLSRELTLYRLLKERVGQNSHFIQLYEVSLEEAPWYLMMEYVEALDLEAWIASKKDGFLKASEELLVEIAAQVAEALQAAHESGILHRDIKPANILITGASDLAGAVSKSQIHVLVADFGIGQIIAEEVLQSGTHRGFTRTVTGISGSSSVAGTLLYMAPEILEANPATIRSDIYSLGVVLWQLLIGNLRAALDPSDWPARVGDPLLREDLRRCLAGDPDQRWTSAGAFAASLRRLPERRAAEARRQAELASLERAAYRRGIFRTAAVAIAILAVVSSLAVIAGHQRREAQYAKAQGALEQAGNIFQLGNQAGRRQKALALLEAASAFPEERVKIRSIAAGVLSLTDLLPDTAPLKPIGEPLLLRAGETARVLSPSGRLAAIGHDLDGVQGTLEIVVANGTQRFTFQRKDFPWVPIPEPGFVQFSPGESLLAMAGTQTSRHILLCKTEDATLQSYIFAEEGLTCFAWHPGSRIIATGGSDGMVRLWDIFSAREARSVATGKNDFDLPPSLASAAIDLPFAVLKGSRAGVCAIAFAPEGAWMAVLDGAGWLRIYSGFIAQGLPKLPDPADAASPAAIEAISKPMLLLEAKLNRADSKGRLNFDGEKLVVSYSGASPVSFHLQPGEIFRETWVASALQSIAWSSDGSQLCAITGKDIYWLAREPLASFCVSKGSNPAAVAFDPFTGLWALPEEKKFLLRKPLQSGDALPKQTEASESFKLVSAEKDQGARFGMAAARDGRLAVYFGKRLQFFQKGKRASDALSVSAKGENGIFDALLWNQSGTIATAVYSIPGGLSAESYATGLDKTAFIATITSPGQQLIAGGDGVNLIERSVDFGITLINAATGLRRSLSSSNEARQNAPMAISADGKWIAAVTDRHLVRIMDAVSGKNYADLSAPRIANIKFLAWHPSGQWLAGLTDDGFVQVWSLNPWREWIEKHKLSEI